MKVLHLYEKLFKFTAQVQHLMLTPLNQVHFLSLIWFIHLYFQL